MSTLACIGNSQLYACMLSNNPNSPSSAACSATDAVGEQVVGTCDASTAMLVRTIKLYEGTVGSYSPDVNGNGYMCCSPTECSVPSAPMCDSTLWYCISTQLPGGAGCVVCVIDNGSPFSMSDCVISTLVFSTYDKQCANITSPIFSSSMTQASTSTSATSQMTYSTVSTIGTITTVGTMTSIGTNPPTNPPTNGPQSSSASHHPPDWVTPLWTTILGSVMAGAIGYLFYNYIWLPYCKGGR